MIPGAIAHPHRVVLAANGTLSGLNAAETKLLAAFPTGGTIQIPTGTHLLSGPWIIDDIINLQGKSGAVLDKNNSVSGFSNPMIGVKATKTNRKWRCRGFKLLGNWDFGLDHATTSDIGLYPEGTIDMRIYNMTIQQFGRAGIQTRGNTGSFQGHPRGVIWGCTFIDFLNNNNNIGYGVEVVGDDADTATPVYGGRELLYIEGNSFTRCRHNVAANNEARYVARYNDIFETRKNASSLDAHGHPAGWNRGSRWVEWYNNTVHSNNVQNANFGMAIRGGGGVWFENDLNNTISNEKYGIQIEGWTSYSAGDKVYPSPFQTGDLEDLWGWDNRYLGNPQSIGPVTSQGGGGGAGGSAENLVEGRDFFNFAKPGYTAYQYPHDKRNGL